MRRSLMFLAAVACLTTAAVVRADEAPASDTPSSQSAFKQTDALLDASPKTRPMMLSFFLGIPYGYYYGCGYYGGCGFPIGVGARFAIPIVPNGFLPMLNDSFDIEFGLDFDLAFGNPVAASLTPIVGAKWNFFLIPKLAVYPKIDIGLGIHPGYAYPVRFYINALLGVVYYITDKISLRAEIGYWNLRGGIGIDF